MNQNERLKQTIINLYKSGKLQKMVYQQTWAALPSDLKKQYKKEGIPVEVQEAITAQVNVQLLELGINPDDLK